MKKIVILFLIITISFISTYSQVEFIDSTDYGKVFTNEFIHFLFKDDFTKVKEFEDRLKEKEITFDDSKHYYIPIVFHFIDSEQIGKRAFSDFTSTQINLLNNNFSVGSTNAKSLFDEYFNDRKETINNLTFFDFTPCANNFYDHITYYPDQAHNFYNVNFDTSLFNSVKTVLPMFVRSHAINVWVTDLNEACDGFASMPFLSSDKQGIVIDINDFAAIREFENKPARLNTLTHLVGNFLGMYSLWGLTFCSDDYVDDTPVHNVPNVFEANFGHFTACPDYEGDIEMINNFMDSGNDALKSMFTYGQISRLKRLLSESNLLYNEPTICDQETVSLRSNGIELTINPIPSTGFSDISVKNSNNNKNYISIHESTSGRIIYQTSFEGDKVLQIDINGYASGTYFVSLVQNGQIVINKKIVKI